jgi:PIN domain nuclease of toxin-antitoxin system
MPTYLDTNTIIFLHSGLSNRISTKAQHQIDTDDLVVSPMALLEVQMLYEKGKLKYGANRILSDLAQQIGLNVCQMPMSAVVSSALAMSWTRDPGDRLIAANAHANNESPLITSDRMIRAHYKNTIW